MNRGFVKIFRKIEDNSIFHEEPYCRLGAWIDLLLMVNHKDGEFMLGMTKMNIRRGQKWTSIGKLADRWKWGRDKVTRYLNLLESEGMIYQERTNRGLLITVVNYANFQDFKTSTRQPNEQLIEQPTEHQTDIKPNSQSDTNKNVKNDIKNEKKNVKKASRFFVED